MKSLILQEKKKKKRWSLKIQQSAVPYNEEHFCMCKEMYIFTTPEKQKRYNSNYDMDYEYFLHCSLLEGVIGGGSSKESFVQKDGGLN